MSISEKCIVIEVEFEQKTIAGSDTRCEVSKHIFRDFRDVEQVESVESYVKKLLSCQSIRNLMITFHTEGDYYNTREGYCRIIREWDNKYRIIKWQARNIIDDYNLDKVTIKDIRALYLATVEKLYDRFPDAENAAC